MRWSCFQRWPPILDRREGKLLADVWNPSPHVRMRNVRKGCRNACLQSLCLQTCVQVAQKAFAESFYLKRWFNFKHFCATIRLWNKFPTETLLSLLLLSNLLWRWQNLSVTSLHTCPFLYTLSLLWKTTGQVLSTRMYCPPPTPRSPSSPYCCCSHLLLAPSPLSSTISNWLFFHSDPVITFCFHT